MRLPRTVQQSLHQQYRLLQHHARMALSKTTTNVLRVAAVIAFIAVLLVATLVFHVQDHIGELIQWIQDNKVIGSVSFVALYALFTVLPVPASVMSLAAGAIFGLPLGSLLVFSGAVIGEIGCFVVGRLLLREWVSSLTKRYDVWQAVEAAVAEEGWKMVLLLRLSPVIPFAPLNYALSLTSISFLAYVWTSALGIIPGVLAYVYIGSLANNVGEIIAGRTRVSPAVTIVSAAVSGVFIIGAMVMITLHARRAIRRRLDQEQALNETFATDAVDGDVREAERLLQDAERHV